MAAAKGHPWNPAGFAIYLHERTCACYANAMACHGLFQENYIFVLSLSRTCGTISIISIKETTSSICQVKNNIYHLYNLLPCLPQTHHPQFQSWISCLDWFFIFKILLLYIPVSFFTSSNGRAHEASDDNSSD